MVYEKARDGAKDANRKRIFELKGFLKSLLFQENEVDMQYISNQRSDLSDHEKNVCLLNTTSLKPYISSKVNYSSTGHLLPFVVLANDLLCCAGYAKFSRNICPIPSPSLNAFRLDAVSLFSTFCSHGSDRVSFVKYDGSPFQRFNEISNHKDVVFNSFFGIANILAACARSKLTFSHNITLLPGLKYVRILGVKKNRPKQTTASLRKEAHNSYIPQSTWKLILQQSNIDKRTSKEETNELQKEVGKLFIRLKDTFKILNDGNLGIKIKVAKQYWKDPLSKPIVEAVPTTADPTTTAVDPDWLNMEDCFCGVIDEVRRIVHNVVVRLSSTPLAVTLPAFAGPSTAITGPFTDPAGPSTAPPIDTYGFSNEDIALARMGLQDIRNEISRYIGFLKEKRYKAFEAVDDCKRKLAEERFQLYTYSTTSVKYTKEGVKI